MIPFHKPDIGPGDIEAVTRVLNSRWLTTGSEASAFEAEFKEIVGAQDALAVNSATTAALLLLQAFGIGPGDEVVVPAWTFSGPAMMAHMLGAKVVLADVDPVSLMLTPETLEPCMTSRTKLVMPTHFAGNVADIAELSDYIGHYDGAIKIIEDAAHAFCSEDYQGNIVGSCNFSDAAFFSFYATKTVTSAEGGMITTNDSKIAGKLRKLRSNGMAQDSFSRYDSTKKAGWQYDIATPGWKANMPDLLAALGREQLTRTYSNQLARMVIANLYTGSFSGMEGIGTPIMQERGAYHLYPIRIKGKTSNGVSRGMFIEGMRMRGVGCSVHFIPLHHHSFWAKTAAFEELPHCDKASKEVVSLPIWPSMTREEVAYVINNVVEELANMKEDLTCL